MITDYTIGSLRMMNMRSFIQKLINNSWPQQLITSIKIGHVLVSKTSVKHCQFKKPGGGGAAFHFSPRGERG